MPKTDLGRLIASIMMLVGWGILAVPTGIVTAEMARQRGVMAGVLPARELAAAGSAPGQVPDPCPECGAGVIKATRRFAAVAGRGRADPGTRWRADPPYPLTIFRIFPSGSLNHAVFMPPAEWMSPTRVRPGRVS